MHRDGHLSDLKLHSLSLAIPYTFNIEIMYESSATWLNDTDVNSTNENSVKNENNYVNSQIATHYLRCGLPETLLLDDLFSMAFIVANHDLT